MTTRATLEDGSVFDIDEETEAKFTHLGDQRVEKWTFVGPTPEGAKRDEDGLWAGSRTLGEPAAAEAEPAEPAGTK